MQTVVETPEFVKDAKRAGLSQRERQAIIDFMAANPDAGAEMPGTGGGR